MCNGPCNAIAFNSLPGTGYDGVRLLPGTGTGNLIIGNATYSNASLGIDLGADGVTPNDLGDGDTGANELQNFPELFAAYGTQSSITIEGDPEGRAFLRIDYLRLLLTWLVIGAATGAAMLLAGLRKS
jgi:hypothetical protein